MTFIGWPRWRQIFGYMDVCILELHIFLFSIIPRKKIFNITRKNIYAYMFQNNKVSEEILSDNHIRKQYQQNT